MPGRQQCPGLPALASSGFVRAERGVKVQHWTHFSVLVEDESLWRVTFDSPPINMVTPEILLELPELIDQMTAAPELRVVVFESANPWPAGSPPTTRNLSRRSSSRSTGTRCPRRRTWCPRSRSTSNRSTGRVPNAGVRSRWLPDGISPGIMSCGWAITWGFRWSGSDAAVRQFVPPPDRSGDQYLLCPPNSDSVADTSAPGGRDYRPVFKPFHPGGSFSTRLLPASTT